MPLVFALLAVVSVAPPAGQDEAPRQPLLRTVDLDRGESQVIELSDGTKARVKLLDVEEDRDGVRSAIREARVKLEVNGQAATLVSANYRLPVTVGGRPDRLPGDQGLLPELRPVRGFLGPGQGRPAAALAGGLALDRRRARSSIPSSSAGSPAPRRWATSRRSSTAATTPTGRPIYYHSGLDIGGCEGMVDVVSATRRPGRLGGRQGPARVRRHPVLQAARITTTSTSSTRRAGSTATRTCKSIDPAIRPGERVKMGQKIGVLGKEGAQRRLVAPALRHQGPAALGQVGHPGGLRLPLGGVPARAQAPGSWPWPGRTTWSRPARRCVLDGSRSWSAGGQDRPLRVDLRRRHAPRRARASSAPTSGRAVYSEILKVTDAAGPGRLRLRRRAGHRQGAARASCRRRSTPATRRRSASGRATR